MRRNITRRSFAILTKNVEARTTLRSDLRHNMNSELPSKVVVNCFSVTTLDTTLDIRNAEQIIDLIRMARHARAVHARLLH